MRSMTVTPLCSSDHSAAHISASLSARPDTLPPIASRRRVLLGRVLLGRGMLVLLAGLSLASVDGPLWARAGGAHGGHGGPTHIAAAAPATANANAGPAAASALPPLPDQSDPWLYRGADVPRDTEWKFGMLSNGLRWAVRENGVPPGQVSIRIRMDVGSLHERPEEAGFAHLIEHLVFRESKYLGPAQAIPTWQRLGATFGTDTNAETTPIHTVFSIDLPDATPATLDESFRLLSGMMIAPTLSEADIRTEAPIVLAEKRENGGAIERVLDAKREVLFAGQPMADHSTIGPVATIEGAHEAAVKAFHARWYRPENAAIIVAGDVDPRLLAALTAKWFGDWPVVGAHTPAPDFGEPKPLPQIAPGPGATTPPTTPPIGPLIGPPVGPARVLVVPGQARSISWAVERPWHEKNDTIVYNQGKMIDELALAIINRRLETGARSNAPFLAAQLASMNESRSLEATYVALTPLDDNWRGGIRAVRQVIADAMAHPPTQAEIAREAAEMNIAYVSQVQQRTLLPGGRLADEMVGALDIHETVTSPEGMLQVFRSTVPHATPAAVLSHTRALVAGSAIRALYVTPVAGDADDAALARALSEPVVAGAGARHAARVGRGGKPGVAAPLAFATLAPIGPMGPEPKAQSTGLLEIERLDLGNGVTALLWPTKEDPGRVTVKVRFGGGYRSFAPGDAPYALLGNLALVSAGEGRLDQEALERISNGRKMGFDFAIGDAAFSFTADTRAEDLADQLYLFADKFAEPRWDAQPILRAGALARSEYDSLAASPRGVLGRDLRYLVHGRDPRYAMATPEELAAATPEGFRKVWEPILRQGPIEVEVYGDVSRAAAIDALRRSFGALPARPPLPAAVNAVQLGLPTPSAEPLVLRHKGDANQAAALVVWPTGGGMAGIHESRQLEVLAQVFSNRLLEAMREKAGASYAPQVGSEWPMDFPSGGTITAQAGLQPEMAATFFATADRIARELAAKPPTPDEMARVLGPMNEAVARAASASAFFMWQVEGGSQDPSRIAALPSIFKDYASVTPEVIQQLAARYLVAERAWRLAVLPEGWGPASPASAPPAGAGAGMAVPASGPPTPGGH